MAIFYHFVKSGKMKEHENVIKEKRTIEATRKNLMGPSGKFGVILQSFGSPIIRQGSSLFDQNFLEMESDSTYTEYASTLSGQKGPVAYRDEILTFDDFISNEGLVFDGLSRGVHLEIIYWSTENKLNVTYKGYTVYLEISGELESYVPFEEWESIVDKMFISAKERAKQMKKQKELEFSEKVSSSKKGFLELLRKKWGI